MFAWGKSTMKPVQDQDWRGLKVKVLFVDFEKKKKTVTSPGEAQNVPAKGRTG